MFAASRRCDPGGLRSVDPDWVNTAFNGQLRFDPASPNPAFVTEPFELSGRTSNVDVWLDSNCQQLDARQPRAHQRGTGVAWNSVSAGVLLRRRSWRILVGGVASLRVVCPSVQAGRYYLRVEPEGDAASRAHVDYSLRVRRDRPALGFYGIALVLLFIPPLAVTLRHASFEHKRWTQSDYGGDEGDDDEDDEDDEDE